jgi:hypothetical protein
MDQVIRECREPELRRGKSSLRARLSEAQRQTGRMEHHFVAAPQTKWAMEIGGGNFQGSCQIEEIEEIRGAQINATFCIGRVLYR